MDNLPQTIALLNQAAEGLIVTDVKANKVLDKADTILDKANDILDKASNIESQARQVTTLLRTLIIVLLVISVIAFLLYALSKGWFLRKSFSGGKGGYAQMEMASV